MDPTSSNRNPTETTVATFLDERDIIIGEGPLTRDEAIHRLVTRLASVHLLPGAGEMEQAIFAREARGDTVIAEGVALPHARLTNLQRPYVAILTSREGIAFAPGKGPVKLIILLFTPLSQPAIHLQILKAIATALRNPKSVSVLASHNSPHDILRFFAGSQQAVSGHLEAADIMYDEVLETLNESDSLEKAIDRLTELKVNILPVVDRYGTMVGVVTINALLRICIPQYLLWMHDLSPMVNFEPFVDMLRNERNSSIADVINKDFAHVQTTDPAISVAAEFVRRNAFTCYVLDGTRLAGVIKLPYFLNKIFRE